MPRVLRILNRLAVGGPVLNATYLTKYLSPQFETLLVVGEKEAHEKSADYLTHQLGISYYTLPGRDGPSSLLRIILPIEN
jgi:hypothetical protein